MKLVGHAGCTQNIHYVLFQTCDKVCSAEHRAPVQSSNAWTLCQKGEIINTPAKTDRHIGENSQIKLGPGETIADPRDPLELQLTSIWEMVLGTKPIGMRDNFFDLGGSTLLVRQLLARYQGDLRQGNSSIYLLPSANC